MKVLLGVTGGIAAYKAAELVRLLQQQGIDVQVAMTASAEEFIRPLTFAALTGHPVLGSLWQPNPADSNGDAEFAIEHVAVAQQIDALVIAPCTANTLAKLAHGLADDLLSTVYLATKAPVLIAPAMNVNMWNHPATQANVRTLEQRGAQIIAPDSGYLACGMTGGGRLAELESIADAVLKSLGAPSQLVSSIEVGSQPAPDLHHETILITAGGTREPIDAVRFLGNRSSGKMGHALAEEAAARGAKVILVTASPLPAKGCEIIRVTTAEEMLAAVLAHLASATIVIKAAAVADFRAATIAPGKLRRGNPLTLTLEPTPDILAHVIAQRAAGTIVIAFAAETENILANGRQKLQRKAVDALFVNDVSSAATGFDSDQNAGFWLTATEIVELTRASKRELARQIVDRAILLRPVLA
jgi:phosphopantothenoylcysteine decarboxylase/phosphopantothenate--cysteine ligase